MNTVLHITQHQQWEQAKLSGIYYADSLETEGFIHCSKPAQIIKVANTFFRHQTGLVLLYIDTRKVQAEIRYEDVDNNELFPHIYGPLNIDAVVKETDFAPDSKGLFNLPHTDDK